MGLGCQNGFLRGVCAPSPTPPKNRINALFGHPEKLRSEEKNLNALFGHSEKLKIRVPGAYIVQPPPR